MNPFLRTFLLPMCLLACPLIAAAETTYVQPLGERFAEERQAVLQRLESGHFKGLKPEDRATVLRLLAEMAETLEGVAAVGELHPAKRSQLYNQQEQVNSLLLAADPDQRVVCRREGLVGSHFRTNKCATVAEWRMIRQGTQKKMGERPETRICDGGPCTRRSDLAPPVNR
jgi:hypothetical protein